MMSKRIVFFGMGLFFSVIVLAGEVLQISKAILKELERHFGADPVVQPLQITEGDFSGIPELKDGDRVYTVHGLGEGSGYLLSTSAKGRYDLFDYSIIYSDTLSVLGVRVTAYRSSHGGAICSKGWLKQFHGYQGEEIELGKHIDSVSGATISAASLVADMQRCHELMKKSRNMGLIH